MDIKKENKRKFISLGSTILFHLIVLLLLLAFGLPYQDPPPPEIGVEMSADDLTEAEYGYSGKTGGGETTDETNVNSNTEDNPTITQNTEEVPLTAKSTKKEPKIQPKKEEPKVDETALFSKGKVKKNGSGNGNGGGDGYANGTGSGASDNGNGAGEGGTSFSLSGRGAKSLSTPKTNKTDVGKVVVEIKVDKEGNVIEAHGGAKGTTIMDNNIWRICEQAARRSKFSAKEDAPEIQKGTITYKFVR